MGITYGIFGAEEEKEAEAEVVEENAEEEEEGEEGVPKPKKEEPEKLPRHILVDEVVEEPNIHFYQVPRLGSYLAIKLEYDSCLSEEAFDSAVVNFMEVDSKKAEQDKERREFEDS